MCVWEVLTLMVGGDVGNTFQAGSRTTNKNKQTNKNKTKPKKKKTLSSLFMFNIFCAG